MQETSVHVVCAKSFFVAAIVRLAAERLRSMRATRMAARLALPLCNQLDRVPGVDRSPCPKRAGSARRSPQEVINWRPCGELSRSRGQAKPAGVDRRARLCVEPEGRSGLLLRQHLADGW